MSEKTFPIQTQRGAKAHPLRIPWSIAELAYSVYNASYKGQTLERLAERGGFGPCEMDMFLPDWRERCSALSTAEAENKRLREAAELSRLAADTYLEWMKDTNEGRAGDIAFVVRLRPVMERMVAALSPPAPSGAKS